MTDYTDLCARLRQPVKLNGREFTSPVDCEAASALESQAREIAELRAQHQVTREHLRDCNQLRYELMRERDALRSRAETAERELDEERLKALSSEGQWIEHSEKLAAERDAALRKVEELRGLLREVVEVVAACHNCLSYEAPELADRVDAALGEKP